MSALGQKQTFRAEIAMSALPPKADIGGLQLHVRFVPKAGVSRCSKNPLSKASLFDHLVGDREHARWNGETESLCGFEIDYEFKLVFLHDR
jgi:hypothetical protein